MEACSHELGSPYLVEIVLKSQIIYILGIIYLILYVLYNTINTPGRLLSSPQDPCTGGPDILMCYDLGMLNGGHMMVIAEASGGIKGHFGA